MKFDVNSPCVLLGARLWVTASIWHEESSSSLSSR